MSSVKTLSYHGKRKFFRAIEEYIQASIEFQTTHTRSGFYETEPKKSKAKYEKAKKELVEMLNKIEMRME